VRIKKIILWRTKLNAFALLLPWLDENKNCLYLFIYWGRVGGDLFAPRPVQEVRLKRKTASANEERKVGLL
jgi:hypothetical protein